MEKIGFGMENWNIHLEDIGRHTSGLTVSRHENKNGGYDIQLWNVKEWEANLRNNNYLDSEVAIIKLGLIYQYIQLMNKKEHHNHNYNIPMREQIREDIKRFQNWEERNHINKVHRHIDNNEKITPSLEMIVKNRADKEI